MERTCWMCGREVGTAVRCPSCGTVLPSGSPEGDERGDAPAAASPPSAPASVPPSVPPSAPAAVPAPGGRTTADPVAGLAPPAPVVLLDDFPDRLVPYLGPEPTSRSLSSGLQVLSIVLAGLALVRALVYRVEASALRELMTDQSLDARSRAIDLDRAAMWLSRAVLATLVLFLVLDVLWRRARRPRAVLEQRGEAYVESAVNVAVPVWFRVVLVAVAAVSALVFVSGSTGRGASLAQVADGRERAAIGLLLAAVVGVLLVFLFRFCDQHLDRRLAISAEARRAPDTVPFVATRREQALFGDEGANMIVTFGLIVAGMLALFIGIGAVAAIFSDQAISGTLWLLGCVTVLFLVVRAFARRRRRG